MYRKGNRIFVGIHPEYERFAELTAVLAAHRPELSTVSSIKDLSSEIRTWLVDPHSPKRLSPPTPRTPGTIFLSGGIRGCPDWQSDFSRLISSGDRTVINPRREDFHPGNTTAYTVQLINNNDAMLRSESVSFWFAKETLNPIVLLELGIASAMTAKKLYVGIEPGYMRSIDVHIQTALARPEVVIVNSLEELSRQISKEG